MAAKDIKQLADDKWWREWLRDTGRALAARLADTVGTRPSNDKRIREIVEELIALERELAE